MAKATQDEIRNCIRLLNWCAAHHLFNEAQKVRLALIVKHLETGELEPPTRASQWKTLFHKMGVKDSELWAHRKLLLSYFSDSEQRYFQSVQRIQSKKLKSMS